MRGALEGTWEERWRGREKSAGGDVRVAFDALLAPVYGCGGRRQIIDCPLGGTNSWGELEGRGN